MSAIYAAGDPPELTGLLIFLEHSTNGLVAHTFGALHGYLVRAGLSVEQVDDDSEQDGAGEGEEAAYEPLKPSLEEFELGLNGSAFDQMIG